MASGPPSKSSQPVLKGEDDRKTQDERINSGTVTPSKATTSSVKGIPRSVSLAEASNKALKSQTTEKSTGDQTLRWPTSPRLKSPSASRRNSNAEISESDSTPRATRQISDSGTRSPPLQTSPGHIKMPRNYSSIAATLETVQESEQGTSPDERYRGPTQTQSGGPQTPADLSRQTTQTTQASTPLSSQTSQTPVSAQSTQNLDTARSPVRSFASSQDTTESEADTFRSRTAEKQAPPKQATQSQPPPQIHNKRTGMGPLRTRPGHEGSSQGILVETETVPSIPQSAIPSKDHDKTDKRPEGSLRGTFAEHFSLSGHIVAGKWRSPRFIEVHRDSSIVRVLCQAAISDRIAMLRI